jgi:chain length determinant protein (polysaccharide antigen chain regulator)
VYAYADEISLRDLLRSIGEQKWWLLMTWALVVGAALAYLTLTKPVYRAEAHLLPPQPQDIQPLNLPAKLVGDVATVTTDKAYNDFLTNLRSRGLRLEYFRAQSLGEHYRNAGFIDELEAFENGFNESLSIVAPNKDDARFNTATFDFTDRDAAVSLLDGFISLAAQRTIDTLHATLRKSIDTRRAQLEALIAGKRQIAAVSREDRMAVLHEAYRVAEQLGIEDGAGGTQLARPIEGGVAVNTVQLPLYSRGTRALGAEIDALKARESNDPFIPGLRELQDELGVLIALQVDKSQLRPMSLDQPAYAAKKPVKPKRLLVALGAVVAGLMLGVFVALLRTQLVKSED